eukprot:2640641-Pleurochrysis_carterae.AAC.1
MGMVRWSLAEPSRSHACAFLSVHDEFRYHCRMCHLPQVLIGSDLVYCKEAVPLVRASVNVALFSQYLIAGFSASYME